MWNSMVFPSHGNQLSGEFSLGNISQIGNFWMIASKKRLGRSLRVARKEVVRRTWLLSVRKRREKERFLERRVTVMEDHHIQGRRMT
jgi:hypothetical protein